MDLISPLFPSAFVTILCVGSMARSVSKRNVDLNELLLCCSLLSDLARSSLIFHMELGAKNNPPPN